MKKLIILLSIFLLTGCTDILNTPSRKVEEFLGKYQTMDTSIIKELDDSIEDIDASDNYKMEYKNLLKKQYQNLSYSIKDENIDGDKASVEVEIEVFDYYNTLEKVDEDIKKYPDEFKEEKDKSRKEKIEEYKIKQLKATTSKTKYTIIFTLTKKNNKWVLDKVSDEDLKKIHGLSE